MSKKNKTKYLIELLQQRDRTILELSKRVQELETTLSGEVWGWTIPGTLTDKENMGLIVPRLEVRWLPLEETMWNWAASYRLVFQGNNNNIRYVPLGYSRRGGTEMPLTRDCVDLPLGYVSQIKLDMLQFVLPAFAICNDVIYQLPSNISEVRKDRK